MKDPRVSDALLGLLDSHGGVDFLSLVSALGESGDPRAVEPLIGMLGGDWSPTIRAASEALGKLKDRRAVGPLIHALKVADSTARRGFLSSLDYDADAPSVGMVVWMDVVPRDWEYRPQVGSALKAITGQDFGEDTKRWASWWESQNK
jgi:HEAT repeat protein